MAAVKNGPNRPSLDPQAPFRDALRRRYPKRAEAASSSRKAAIELHCLECLPESRADAIGCENRDCFLWPHGFGRKKRQDN